MSYAHDRGLSQDIENATYFTLEAKLFLGLKKKQETIYKQQSFLLNWRFFSYLVFE